MEMDLSHINLDDEIGNNPADIAENGDSTNPQSQPEVASPTPESQSGDTQTGEPDGTDPFNRPADPNPSQTTENDGSQADPNVSSSGSNPEANPEADASQPWHLNPEWQQMQKKYKEAEERAHKAELEAAELRGKTSVQTQSTEPEVDMRNPNVIAEELYIKKFNDGWKPQDRAEELRVFQELKDEVLAKQTEVKTREAEAQEQQVAQRRAQILADVNKVYETEQVAVEHQQLVAQRVTEWMKEGFISKDSNPAMVIERAVKYLRAEGLMPANGKVPSATNPQPVANPQSTQPTANSRIARPGAASGNNSNTPTKPSIQELRAKGLEGIILDAMEQNQ